MKAGIVGLPNVGKSTLFNCLSNSKAQSANFPFCTIEPNIGVINVPDSRLDKLNDLVNPEKVIPTVVEIVDIAGLVKGASKGEGLGNKFLANIRETDAIIHVLRCFDNDNIVHVDGSIDPVRDKEIIDIELQLKDLEVVAKKLEKVARVAKTGNNYVEEVKKSIKDKSAEIIILAAGIESEINELSEHEERKMFLNDLGLDEPGSNKLLKSTYSLLSLHTYFTAGIKEVRAWTIPIGSKASQAAGVIHSDFEKGFIKTEVISYSDYIGYGSELKAKEAGKMRVEGKDYVVNDGDVMHFLFNVW